MTPARVRVVAALTAAAVFAALLASCDEADACTGDAFALVSVGAAQGEALTASTSGRSGTTTGRKNTSTTGPRDASPSSSSGGGGSSSSRSRPVHIDVDDCDDD